MHRCSNWSWRTFVLPLIAGIGFGLMTAPACAQADPRPDPGVAITPRPAQVQLTGQDFHLPATLVLSVSEGDPAARATATYLRAALQAQLHRPVAIGSGGAIRLERVSDPMPAEGYRLSVTPQGITLRAQGDAGLFYAAVTLSQILEPPTNRAAGDPAQVPGMEITDAPRFGWRGVMLDSARHYQSPEWIRRFIDEMARHKLNILHWHLTDDQAWRLEIRRYPRLAEVGGWRVEAGEHRVSGGIYTQAQVRALVAYAAVRHVTILPEIEMPGHATAALAAYPDLSAGAAPRVPASGWGVYPNLFKPLPATLKVLEDILDEVTDLFPSRFIHIGGDEAVKDAWKSSPEVQAQIRALGLKDETALQAWMVRQMAAHLDSRGRRLMGWDEILNDDLPPSAAVMSWHGVAAGRSAARAGHDAVLSPVLPLYLDYRQGDAPEDGPGRGVFPLKLVYDFDPDTNGLDPAAAAHVLGVQANIWTELLRSEARVEAAAFPRLAALAEVAWTPAERRDWSDFLDRLPGQLAAYHRRGIGASNSALRVRLKSDPGLAGRAIVTLSTQAHLGTLRYTLDGSQPRPDSKRFALPIDAALPVRVRAAAFRDDMKLPGELDEVIESPVGADGMPLRLSLCTSGLALSLESQAGPVVRVDSRNPCWQTPEVAMDGAAALRLSLVSLPYNFELGEEAAGIALDPSLGAGGRMEVHLDRCDGPVVAALSLGDPARSLRQPIRMPLATTTGRHSLCLQVRRSTPGPFWALEQASLLAVGGMKNPPVP